MTPRDIVSPAGDTNAAIAQANTPEANTSEVSAANRLAGRAVLEDSVRHRFKLAALWTSAMFLYAYADIIHFTLQPGSIEGIVDGNLDGFAITSVSLFGAAALMTCSALMIAACAVLPVRLCRYVTIGYGVISSLMIPVLAFTGETWAYYRLFNFFEVVLTLSIIRLAIKWPRTPSN